MTAFNQQARSQYGPGYESATPFQIANYYANLGKTNALANNQLNYLNTYQNLANAAVTGSQVAPGTPATAAAPFQSAAQTLQAPLSNLQSQQLLGYQGGLNQYNANVAQNASRGQALGQFATGLGQLGLGLSQSNALASLLGSGRGLV
jgi:hypothetical protein